MLGRQERWQEDLFVAPTFTVKELTRDTLPDFEALFGKHKGVRGGCWCTYNRCTSSQYDCMSRDERNDFQKEQACQGSGHGLIINDETTPIAWCQYGPADGFPRYDRGRAYSALTLPTKTAPLWRISCIFVDKDRRREGLSRFVLKAAIDSIRRRGGGTIEAFPLDVPGVKTPPYTGSIDMDEREGFRQIARVGKRTVLMRRAVRGSKRESSRNTKQS